MNYNSQPSETTKNVSNSHERAIYMRTFKSSKNKCRQAKSLKYKKTNF